MSAARKMRNALASVEAEARHRTVGEHIAEREARERAQTERINAFLAEQHRYETDPAYRAEQDADRAVRQAAVYAKMDAGIARFRAALDAAVPTHDRRDG